MLRVLIFTAKFYGLKVNIASENVDSTSNRLDRIVELMKESKFSVHDLSKLQSEKKNEFYRMNMPFELGLDYGMSGKDKTYLIFEDKQYQLHKALSDINGWDVRAHNNEPEKIVSEFRTWIVGSNEFPDIIKNYSSTEIWYLYNDFQASFHNFMINHKMKEEDVSIKEFIMRIDEFLKIRFPIKFL